MALNPSIAKPAGLDSVSARCLRDLSTEISVMLTFIFQQNLNTGSILRAGLVGAIVRSLLSYHKVTSSIPALQGFEYLCDLLFRPR